MNDRVWIAGFYHEAGHAIAYLDLGYDFLQVHVDGDGLGAVDVRPQPRDARDLLIVTYAGPAAEWTYVHGAPSPYFPDVDEWDAESAETDLEGDAFDVWQLRPLTYASGIPDQYERAAWDLLSRRWTDVEKVANALTERGTMTYEEVLCVL